MDRISLFHSYLFSFYKIRKQQTLSNMIKMLSIAAKQFWRFVPGSLHPRNWCNCSGWTIFGYDCVGTFVQIVSSGRMLFKKYMWKILNATAILALHGVTSSDRSNWLCLQKRDNHPPMVKTHCVGAVSINGTVHRCSPNIKQLISTTV